MRKLNKIILGFFAASFLAANPPAHAQNEGPDGPAAKWHSGQRIQELYGQLNLTEDQKKQLEANKQQHRTVMQKARQDMKASREAFQTELMKPQLDMPRINAIHNQIKLLQSQMEDNKLSSILAVRAILTPEQFQKFVGMMHKHERDREDRERNEK